MRVFHNWPDPAPTDGRVTSLFGPPVNQARKPVPLCALCYLGPGGANTEDRDGARAVGEEHRAERHALLVGVERYAEPTQAARVPGQAAGAQHALVARAAGLVGVRVRVRVGVKVRVRVGVKVRVRDRVRVRGRVRVRVRVRVRLGVLGLGLGC